MNPAKFTTGLTAAQANGLTCVGVAADTVEVRGSKLGASSPLLKLDENAFHAFLDQAKSGTFDQPA